MQKTTKPTELDLNITQMRKDAMDEMLNAIRTAVKKLDELDIIENVLRVNLTPPSSNGHRPGAAVSNLDFVTDQIAPTKRRYKKSRRYRAARVLDYPALGDAVYDLATQHPGIESAAIGERLRALNLISSNLKSSSTSGLLTTILQQNPGRFRVEFGRGRGHGRTRLIYTTQKREAPPADATTTKLQTIAKTVTALSSNMWTCPDCQRVLKASGRGSHRAKHRKKGEHVTLEMPERSPHVPKAAPPAPGPVASDALSVYSYPKLREFILRQLIAAPKPMTSLELGAAARQHGAPDKVHGSDRLSNHIARCLRECVADHKVQRVETKNGPVFKIIRPKLTITREDVKEGNATA